MTNVEDYLKQNVFGTPQLKPDERKKFLGNFQERVALALTVEQVKNTDNLVAVEKVVREHPQYRMFLNGRLPAKYRKPYLQLAVKNNFHFTIADQSNVRTSSAQLSDQDMGLVIADENKSIK